MTTPTDFFYSEVQQSTNGITLMPVTYKGFLFTIQGDADEIRVVVHQAPGTGTNDVLVARLPLDPLTAPEPTESALAISSKLMGEKAFADWAENHMADFVDGEIARRNPFGLH